MKNTQRHVQVSVIKPPSVGPKMGAAIIPRLQKAIALPCSLPGNSSSSTACESGCSPPPVKPWITRKTISMGRFGASPQSRLDSVNPVTASKSRRLRPNTPASQPVTGRIMAFATR